MNAVMAFAHIKDPRAIEPIKALFEKRDETLAWLGAGYALVNQGDAGIDALISSAEKSTQETVDSHFGIAESMELIKGEDAIQWAVDALNSTDKRKYEVAVSILADVSYSLPEKAKAIITPSIASRVLDVMLTSDLETARHAASVLSVVTDKDIVEKLISIALDKKNSRREAALIALTECKDPRIEAIRKSDSDDKQ
jgi:HEAT repeat protein